MTAAAILDRARSIVTGWLAARAARRDLRERMAALAYNHEQEVRYLAWMLAEDAALARAQRKAAAARATPDTKGER